MMGLILGIIAKAVLLSLVLTAVGFLISFVVKGDFRIGVISFGIGVLLFLLLLWQSALLFGGYSLKRQEDRLLRMGEVSMASLDDAIRVLPLSSGLQEIIQTVKDIPTSLETVRSIRKETNIYIWKRVIWMSFFEILLAFLMCRLQQKTPKRRNRRSSGTYGHYQSMEDF